jgi:hypothetical protein
MLHQHRDGGRPVQELVLGSRRVDDPALAAIVHEQDQLVVVAALDGEAARRLGLGGSLETRGALGKLSPA